MCYKRIDQYQDWLISTLELTQMHIYFADICSLRADVERLAFSVIWVYATYSANWIRYLGILFALSFYYAHSFSRLNVVDQVKLGANFQFPNF